VNLQDKLGILGPFTHQGVQSLFSLMLQLLADIRYGRKQMLSPSYYQLGWREKSLNDRKTLSKETRVGVKNKENKTACFI